MKVYRWCYIHLRWSCTSIEGVKIIEQIELGGFNRSEGPGWYTVTLLMGKEGVFILPCAVEEKLKSELISRDHGEWVCWSSFIFCFSCSSVASCNQSSFIRMSGWLQGQKELRCDNWNVYFFKDRIGLSTIKTNHKMLVLSDPYLGLQVGAGDPFLKIHFSLNWS